MMNRRQIGTARRVSRATLSVLGVAAATCLVATACDAVANEKTTASPAPKPEQLCASIAASAETARIGREQKLLASLEQQLSARLSALEQKEREVAAMLDRVDGAERKASDALVALYTNMKPDAAAAQLAALDVDIAAALLMRLKPKISSAILDEIDAERGAALASRLADNRIGSARRP